MKILPFEAPLSGILFLYLVLVMGCAGTTSHRYDWRVEQVDEEVRETPEVQAALSRLDASLNRESSVHVTEEIELRFNQIGMSDNDASLNDSMEVQARLPLNSISEIRTARRVFRAETEIAVGELESELLQQESLLCDESMLYQYHTERAHILEEFQYYTEQVEFWLNSLSEAQLIEEIIVSEVRLESAMERMEVAADTSMYGVHSSFLLPQVEDTDEVFLTVDPVAVQQLIQESNPSVSVIEANRDRFQAMASRSASQRWPHLDFFEVSVEPFGELERDAYTAQIAFDIPLPGISGQEERELLSLSEAEAFDRDALVLSLTELAVNALNNIKTFTQQASYYTQLVDEANRAEALSLSALEERRGDPEEVFRLYRRAYQARMLILDRRYETGQNICDLYSITGFHVDDIFDAQPEEEWSDTGSGSSTDTITSESGLLAD